MEQIGQALKKNARIIIKEVDEAGVKAIEKMVADDIARISAAEGLSATSSIAPYKLWKAITRKLGGDYQAHHILEEQWFRNGLFKGDASLVPSVILTRKAHEKMNSTLQKAAERYGEGMTKENLWKIYQEAYKDWPHYLKAIEGYFK